MNRILVALDGSEPAEAALRLAADMAGKLGKGLLLLMVVEPPWVAPGGPCTAEELLSGQRAWAERYLQGQAQALSRKGLDVLTQVEPGSAAECVGRLAGQPEVDLVVVGSRGRGAMASILLGSVATHLSHTCPKPLLIARGLPTGSRFKPDPPPPAQPQA